MRRYYRVYIEPQPDGTPFVYVGDGRGDWTLISNDLLNHVRESMSDEIPSGYFDREDIKEILDDVDAIGNFLLGED